MPLAGGGAPFDIGNTAVLCRSCNSTKGASDPDRGSPHEGSALADNRVSMSTSPNGVDWINHGSRTYTLTPTYAGLIDSNWGTATVGIGTNA